MKMNQEFWLEFVNQFNKWAQENDDLAGGLIAVIVVVIGVIPAVVSFITICLSIAEGSFYWTTLILPLQLILVMGSVFLYIRYKTIQALKDKK